MMRTCSQFFLEASNKTVLKFREAMSTYDQYDTVPDDQRWANAVRAGLSE